MKYVFNLSELDSVLYEKWSALDDVNSYLNDAGHAAKEAYKSVLWHINFFKDLEDFFKSEEFAVLSNISEKHPEYYKTLRKIHRLIEASLEKMKEEK